MSGASVRRACTALNARRPAPEAPQRPHPRASPRGGHPLPAGAASVQSLASESSAVCCTPGRSGGEVVAPLRILPTHAHCAPPLLALAPRPHLLIPCSGVASRCLQSSQSENISPAVIMSVAKELRKLSQEPLDGIKVVMNEEDVTDITADITGPGARFCQKGRSPNPPPNTHGSMATELVARLWASALQRPPLSTSTLTRPLAALRPLLHACSPLRPLRPQRPTRVQTKRRLRRVSSKSSWCCQLTTRRRRQRDTS